MKIELETPVQNSFRVQQVSGMFSLKISEKATNEIEYELPPSVDGDWKIGLIVGPSGTGKTSVAKQLYGKNFIEKSEWNPAKAVIDGFDERLSIKDVTHILTAVGFSSPPCWIKPYGVLSNGEKFRCDLAKALSVSLIEKNNPIIAFDEFTSVVDRTVGKVASAAIAKSIKNGFLPCKFVAVSCHYDIQEWLEPDWVLDMATGKVERRLLRRPEIQLEVRKSTKDRWSIYRKYHYLDTSINASSRCYEAFIEGQPCAFLSVITNMGHKGMRRVNRLVVLPDYQGIGVGINFLNYIAKIHKNNGDDFRIITSNPAMINSLKKSREWILKLIGRTTGDNPMEDRHYKNCKDRITARFKYIGIKN